MADKTPAEKLHLKSGMSAALLHVPRDLEGKLGIPAEVTTFREATSITETESSSRLLTNARLPSQEKATSMGSPPTAIFKLRSRRRSTARRLR